MIVDALKQLPDRGDSKIFCTNVSQSDTLDQDVSVSLKEKSTAFTSGWVIATHCVSELVENDQCGVC